MEQRAKGKGQRAFVGIVAFNVFEVKSPGAVLELRQSGVAVVFNGEIGNEDHAPFKIWYNVKKRKKDCTWLKSHTHKEKC